MKSIHFNGSDETIELVLRTMISLNQISVYGAVADMWRISQRLKMYGEAWSGWEYGVNGYSDRISYS